MRGQYITAAFLAAALLAGGCSEERRSPGPDSLDDVDVSPVTTVEVDESGFDPATLTIEAGQAFDLVNTGDDPHSLEMDDPYLDTGDLLAGETTRISLRTTGTHLAVDGLDPDHTLEITVTG